MGLGVAFKGKPQTSDLRGSTALKILQKLQEAKFTNIHAYDPAVFEKELIQRNIKYVATPEAGFRDADAVLVMNNNPIFENLKIRNLLKLSKNPTLLFDGWSMFNTEEISKINGVTHKRL